MIARFAAGFEVALFGGFEIVDHFGDGGFVDVEFFLARMDGVRRGPGRVSTSGRRSGRDPRFDPVQAPADLRQGSAQTRGVIGRARFTRA